LNYTIKPEILDNSQIQIESLVFLCEECWLKIKDFNTYYVKVKEKHLLKSSLDIVLKTEDWNESDKMFLEGPHIPIAFVAENESCPDTQFEVHNEEIQDYKCDIDECQKTFSKKHSLDVHKRSRHSVKKGSKLTCSECGKIFASKYSLSVHINGKSDLTSH
jgi:hypothetical protein